MPEYSIVPGVRTATASTPVTDDAPLPVGIKPKRKGYVLLRDVTINSVNTPATPTLADVATGGSLVFNTSYKVAAVAKSESFQSAASAVATLTTASDAVSTHVVRVTLAQVANATRYLIFMSTAASPTFLAEITETQRAAGGCRITAMGVVDAAGSNPAGTVDILVAATANQCPATSFATALTFHVDGIVTVQPTTTEDVATGGTLSANTQYTWAVAAGTRHGVARPSVAIAVTTANDASATHVVRATIPQTPGAEYYCVFLFAGAPGGAALYVANITETQRAAGGCRITAMGVVDAAGSNPAGTVDIQAVGTGVAVTSSPFTGSLNGGSPVTQTTLDGLTQLDCTGYSKLRIHARVDPLDMRTSSNTVAVLLYESNSVLGGWATLYAVSAGVPSSAGFSTIQPQNSNTPEVTVAGGTLVASVAGMGGAGGARVRVYADLYN